MIVTLLTDFGTADYFVGAMKGALLSVNPRALLVDITHEIPPQDIEAGAFTLAAALEAFPEGSVHLAVVGPGVGSARRAVVVEGGGQLFVGPDNGLFGHVYERLAQYRVFHVTSEKYFRARVSEPFHGRDVFAPGADAPGEPFAVGGSAGFLELAVFRDSAARVLGVGRGQEVKVKADASGL